MFVLIFIKKALKGTLLDRAIRIVLNFCSKYYHKYLTKKVNLINKNLVFIFYGGLGDCILMLPLVNRLSKNFRVNIFLEEKLSDLSLLTNKNINFINYKKNNLLKELRLFSKSNSNYFLIQQSPIFEFCLFHFLLKRPPVIGFIYRQNLISFQCLSGFNIITKFNYTKS